MRPTEREDSSALLSTGSLTSGPARARRDYEIDLSEIEMGEQLGAGSYGVVFKGRFRGAEVAVKKLHSFVDSFGDVDFLGIDAYLHELDITARLRHPSIVLLQAAVLDPAGLCVVLEFARYGSLKDRLGDKKAPLSRQEGYVMMASLAAGVEYLHSFQPPLIHRDIKSENVLLVANEGVPWQRATAKLADFGEASEQRTSTMSQSGTPLYMAPEVIAGDRYTTAIDVYSLGILFCEISRREMPFANLLNAKHGLNLHSFLENVMTGMRGPLPSDKAITRLVEEMWAQDGLLRPTATEVTAQLRELSNGDVKEIAPTEADNSPAELDLVKAKGVEGAGEVTEIGPPPSLNIIKVQHQDRRKLGHSLKGSEFASAEARRGGRMREKTLFIPGD